MFKSLKPTLVSAVMLVLAARAVTSQTAPTVITADDVVARFADLKAKDARSPQDLRELTVLTLIAAAGAPELSRKAVKTYVHILGQLMDATGDDPEVHAIRAAFHGIEAAVRSCLTSKCCSRDQTASAGWPGLTSLFPYVGRKFGFECAELVAPPDSTARPVPADAMPWHGYTRRSAHSGKLSSCGQSCRHMVARSLI